MNLKTSVLSGLRWTAGMRLLSKAFTWVVTIFVLRLLSPADYGLMELAGVFVAFLIMIGEFGLGAAIVQRKDLDEESIKSLFGLILLISFSFTTLLYLTAPVIASYYNQPILATMLRWLAVSFPVLGFAIVPQSLLLRELQYQKIAIVDFLSAIFGSVATLVCALNGLGVWSLIVGYLMLRVTTTVAMQLFRPFIHFPRLSFKGMGAVYLYSGNVTLSRVLWYFYSSAVASLLIGKILGADLLGVYAVGLYLACMPMEKVGGIINRVAFPAFSSIQAEPNLAGKYFLKAVRVLSFISIPIFWGMSCISPEIIGVFLGDKWSSAAVPLQIIALIIPLRMVRNLMTPAMLGLGRSDINLFNEVVAVVVMPLAFYIGTYWGVLGVSLVWLLVFPVVFVINMSMILKILQISSIEVFSALHKPVMAGLLMYLGVFLMRYTPCNELSLTIRMIVYILTGGIIYCLSTFALNKTGVDEIRSLRESKA